jgi:predicted DNA-binding transcriptional regulator YafY
VTNGHWWYSNTPTFIEHDCAARLEAVPRSKQIGYYSDMYKLEFALPKFAMYKRILAKVLAERFVIDRGWSEERAKLEQGLPPVLAAYVEQTLRILAEAPRDERFRGHVHDLTRAWAERRVVEIDYEPARYSADRARRRARVRPYLIEPSLQTHALYLIGHDETKEAMRTFKIERIKAVTLTPRTFEPPSAGVIEGALRRAWDIIADRDPVRVVLRFAPSVAERVGETNWHPTQRLEGEADGAVRWSATVAGTIEIRLWILSWGDEVEVLEPAELRADVRATLERAAALYRGAGEAGP